MIKTNWIYCIQHRSLNLFSFLLMVSISSSEEALKKYISTHHRSKSVWLSRNFNIGFSLKIFSHCGFFIAQFLMIWSLQNLFAELKRKHFARRCIFKLPFKGYAPCIALYFSRFLDLDIKPLIWPISHDYSGRSIELHAMELGGPISV